MIGNVKKTFPPKTSMQEKQLLQDPGYAACQHCRYMYAMKQGAILIVFTVYVDTLDTYNQKTM